MCAVVFVVALFAITIGIVIEAFIPFAFIFKCYKIGNSDTANQKSRTDSAIISHATNLNSQGISIMIAKPNKFCKECSYTFISNEELNTHIQEKHKMDTDQTYGLNLFCRPCNMTFDNINEKRKHLYERHQDIIQQCKQNLVNEMNDKNVLFKEVYGFLDKTEPYPLNLDEIKNENETGFNTLNNFDE